MNDNWQNFDASLPSWAPGFEGLMAIVGFTLALFFYFKSRRLRWLSYDFVSYKIVTNSLSSFPKFKATYEDNPIDNLTVTKVIIWNSGTEVLTDRDIASSDPLRIVFPDNTKILQATVNDVSTPTNLATVQLDESSPGVINVGFEYLARKEGFVVSLLHDGRDDIQPVINGTVKGGDTPKPFPSDKQYYFFEVTHVLLIIATAYFISRLTFNIWGLIGSLILILVIVIGRRLLIKFFYQKSGGSLDESFGDRRMSKIKPPLLRR